MKSMLLSILIEKKKRDLKSKKIFVESLGICTDGNSKIVLSALIEDKLREANISALNNLKLNPGDQVNN